MCTSPAWRVLRWDHDLEPNEDDMEFRLTYEGKLLATRNDKRVLERSHHIHDIRQVFHKQLKFLWQVHPVLIKSSNAYTGAQPGDEERFEREGFTFLPIATKGLGLICKLDILMLREGNPGNVPYDIDNRIKTLFDALRMPKGPQELGDGTPRGKRGPEDEETPFYVLLEDDNLITHLSVTSDRLLEPVPDVPTDQAVRLFIDVTVRPYDVHMDNLGFS